MQVPPAIGHVKRPGSPFAARGADVQVLGLDDAVLDVRHQSLLGMGYELLAMGYIGPRHAIRAADLRTMAASSPHGSLPRGYTVVSEFRSCGGHVRCMDHQRGRGLVNRETVNVESDRPYCCCVPVCRPAVTTSPAPAPAFCGLSSSWRGERP